MNDIGRFETDPYIKMPYSIRQRKRTRKPGIDYSRPGFYFATICTKQKEETLGKVVGENMEPNDYGRIVQESWLALPDHYSCCRLHEFMIMPNHVHGIIEIAAVPNVGAGLRPARTLNPKELRPARTLNPEEFKSACLDKPARCNDSARSSPSPSSLSEIIRAFKSFSSRTINQKYPDGLFQWQRSFHDRVIRDNGELAAIARYIIDNPRHWAEDEENLNVGAGLRPARTLKPEELRPARS